MSDGYAVIHVTIRPQPLACEARAVCAILTHSERRLIMRRRGPITFARMTRLQIFGLLVPYRGAWRWTALANEVRRVLRREGLVGLVRGVAR